MATRGFVPKRWFCAAAFLTGAIIVAAHDPAYAEVKLIKADPRMLIVQVRDATVRDVLDALASKQLIDFQSSETFSRVLTGRYAGTLPQVLSRILNGYNYFVHVTPSGARLQIIAGAPGDKMTASFVSASRPVSYNVDLDEEKAAEAARARIVVAPPSPAQRAPTPPPSVSPRAGTPISARISTNVDLDEENSR